MKKVIVLLAEGFEEIEALTPVDLLRRAGVSVEMLSIDGSDSVVGSHKIEVLVDGSLRDKKTMADAIVLPGGLVGMKNLDSSELVSEIVQKHYKAGKYVAAICAAPSVLGHLGILDGKSATCYPGFEKELKGADLSMDSVVVDKNVITSRGMGTAMDFGLKLVEILTDENTAKDLGKGVIYEK